MNQPESRLGRKRSRRGGIDISLWPYQFSFSDGGRDRAIEVRGLRLGKLQLQFAVRKSIVKSDFN